MICHFPIKACLGYNLGVFFILAYLLLSCCICITASGINEASTHDIIVQCIHDEREALLQFKHGLVDDHCGLLASWGDHHHHDQHLDCCQWHGVHCNNQTNHVIRLTLGGEPCLEGTVSPSLLKLKHLRYLDLSLNDFRGQTIPSFMGSFTYLQHLNLSKAGFSGEIPHQLGNLSNLQSLDLTCDYGNSYGCPYVINLRWLSNLTLLKNIFLSGIDLSKASDDWFQTVNHLLSLRVLHMDNCGLSPTIPTSGLSYTNSSTTISIINLNDNNLNDTSVFNWLFNLSGINNSSLVHLDLSNNQISGLIPSNFGELMHSLSYLDLHSNLLEGPIPSTFWNMRNMSYLSLGTNKLEGPIPHTITELKQLTHLILSDNNFQGSEIFPHFIGNLCDLQEMSLNINNLEFEFSAIIRALSAGCTHKSLLTLDLSQNRVWGSIPDMISTFSSLKVLNLNSNNLNGTVSQGIGQLSMLELLDISFNSLKQTLSHSHFSNLTRLQVLDLSNNPDLVLNISSDWIPPFQLTNINMDYCKLGPSFPKWLITQTNVSYLSMSNAGISDTIPASFWTSLSPFNLVFLNASCNMIAGVLPDLSLTLYRFPVVDLSSNNFSGAIPSFFRNSGKLYLDNNRLTDLSPFFCPKHNTPLVFLRLANNLFSGELPDCWMYFDQLAMLRLENNRFSGSIPASMGALTQLSALHLRNNSLSGDLPQSFYNCTSLVVLDLGYNSLTGHISPIIGQIFVSLRFFSLQSNKFHGSLPSSLCQLSFLQVLDVSINHISGVLPNCLYNLTAMTSIDNLGFQDMVVNSVYMYYAYSEYARLMWKRKEQSFLKRSMGQMKAIDVSSNDLKGDIPEGISNLTGLVFLNLSRNILSGSITSQIGQLTSLEFLDLSNNQLSGEIPTGLSQVSTLAILDLSNNNLSGKIPAGTQLQGFDTSAYSGNPGLCGNPLPKCPRPQPPAVINKGDDQDNDVNGEIESGSSSHDLVVSLCISIVLGFIIGFWGVCGTLVIKTSWRHAFFRFLDNTKDKFCEIVVKYSNRIRHS